jgi:protein-arginine kinase activator protein McsA
MIYSNVLLNNKHDSEILNKYKKEYLNTLLNKFISEEKYEECIDIRNKLSDLDENI